MGFGLVVAAGFGRWRFHPVSALLRYFTRNDYDPERILRRYVRWFDLMAFAVGAYCGVWLVIQIVTGSGT